MQLWIKSLKTFRWKLPSKVMRLFILEKLQDRIIWQNLKNFVDNLNNFDYTIKGIEAWLSLVERCVRDAEAASSNLVASIGKNYLLRPVGQAVKTTPSHGVNPGSIPGEVIRCFGHSPKHFYSSKGSSRKMTGIAALPPKPIKTGRMAGSYALRILQKDASVAQLVAHFTRNERVAGSSPARSFPIMKSRSSSVGGLFFINQEKQESAVKKAYIRHTTRI